MKKNCPYQDQQPPEKKSFHRKKLEHMRHCTYHIICIEMRVCGMKTKKLTVQDRSKTSES